MRLKRRIATAIAVGAVLISSVLISLLVAPGAQAGGASGYEDGKLRIPLPGDGDAVAFDILTLPGGSAIVAGSLFRSSKRDDGPFLAKLDPDGALDPSFGDGGLRLSFAGAKRTGVATAVSLDQKGRLLAAGFSGTDVFVARFDAAGVLDPSFGDGGVFVVPSPHRAEATSGDGLEVRPDGRIVVSVEARADSQRAFQQGAVQILPDGGLDRDFARGGRRLIGHRLLAKDFLSRRKHGTCTGCGTDGMALDRKGGVLLVGENGHGMAVVRLRPGGRVDRGFGQRGVARLKPKRRAGQYAELRGSSVLVRASGNLVVVGDGLRSNFTTSHRIRAGFAFAGLTADGRPDRRFAHGKVRIVKVDRGYAVALDAARTPSGGFAATGYRVARDNRFALAIVDRRGRVDREQMPRGGSVPSPRSGEANAVAFDEEGRALLAGYGYADEEQLRAVVVRAELGS